jgi:hypothetical protein
MMLLRFDNTTGEGIIGFDRWRTSGPEYEVVRAFAAISPPKWLNPGAREDSTARPKHWSP